MRTRAGRNFRCPANPFAFPEPSLDGGLDATVSENGTNFSAGERQKLSLARAILRRPRLFILDEATSSVDNASEQAFHRWLATEPCTALVISHKELSLRWVDRTLYLEK